MAIWRYDDIAARQNQKPRHQNVRIRGSGFSDVSDAPTSRFSLFSLLVHPT